jgi:uncharacterized membrane protein YcaP (DUF421 family)
MRLPEPPELRRRLEAPWRTVALVVALASLPAFVLAGHVDAEARRAVVHVLVAFVVLMVAFRVMGKRELGRLSPFELVTLMLIPEILSNTVQGEGSLLSSLAGLSMILLLVFGTSLLSQRFPVVQRAMESEPTLLVVNGKLLEHNMNRERIAPDELFSEMRKQSIQRLSELRFAVLESSGNITFISKRGQTARGEESAEAAE